MSGNGDDFIGEHIENSEFSWMASTVSGTGDKIMCSKGAGQNRRGSLRNLNAYALFIMQGIPFSAPRSQPSVTPAPESYTISGFCGQLYSHTHSHNHPFTQLKQSLKKKIKKTLCFSLHRR